MSRLKWLALVAAALFLAGCNPGSPNATPTPVDVRAIMDEAAAVVSDAHSFRVIIERTGAPVYVDTADTTGAIEFMRAEAEYAAPDRIMADVKIKIGGLVVSGDFIAIGTAQYLANPTLTGGNWWKYDFVPGLDPAGILAENGGLQAALRSVRDLQLVGVENRDGVESVHVRGVGDGAEVANLTLGLIGGGDVEVDAWIGAQDRRVIRVEVLEPNRPLPEGRSDPPFWTIELFDYNAPVEIEPPTEFAVPAETLTATPPPGLPGRPLPTPSSQ